MNVKLVCILDHPISILVGSTHVWVALNGIYSSGLPIEISSENGGMVKVDVFGVNQPVWYAKKDVYVMVVE